MADPKAIGSPIPCRQCGNCNMLCPQSIGIKECFAAKNEYIKTGDYEAARTKLIDKLEKGNMRRPDACEHCRTCEDLCPNELPIRMLIQSVSYLFEL